MRALAALAAVLALIALAGCAPTATSGGSAGSQTPVVTPKSVQGALPGAQVVAVAKLRKSDQAAIDGWVAADKPADQLPTLKPGSYKPLIDGHVLEASEDTGSENGIAVSLVTLHFDPEGTKLLADYTTANVGQTIAVVLDSRVVMASDVVAPVTQGQLQITGPPETIDSVAKSIVPAK